MNRLLRHIRLLPAVMILAAALLVIKGEGLIEARAQGRSVSPAVAHSTKSDPATDDTEQGSASTVDVLTSLAHRRAELDAREQELTTRENLIAAAAKRVDQRIAELKALQTKLQSLLGQRDAAEQKQFDQLVKSYSSMRPKDAARIFTALNEEVLVPVAAAMKADVLGAILAQMQPEDAQRLTVKLAGRLNPQKIETQAAQLAGSTPPVQAAQQPPAQAAPAPAQPDPASAAPAPAQTPQPQQSAENVPATPAPQQSAPAQPAAAKPAAKHSHRAKKLAMAQAAFTRTASMQPAQSQVAPVQQVPANAAPHPQQTAPAQQTAMSTAQRPPQPAAQAPSPPANNAIVKPAPTPPPQPAPQRTAPALAMAPVASGTTTPAAAASPPPAAK